ncbi:hypothetical protein HK102_010874 [Quaeritorhiza haematococci]|nr:hypothetical protein HK102_010874 [Quaeritorhiza haematococci]
MFAVTFHGKQQVRVTKGVPVPTIKYPTDAIVRVTLAGICGSDLHVYHEREKGCDHGTIMGHEFVGIVEGVGTSVTSVTVGSKVMCPFTVSCGSCFYCSEGLTARCIKSQLFGWRSGGKGLHGGQAQYVRVPLADSSLVKIPNRISDEEALLMGDILATGYFCASNGEINPHKKQVVAIVGCGPVGLMGVVCAQELGASKVFALDMVPERLQMASKLGATASLQLSPDVDEKQVIDPILQATDGRGADVVLELVGSSKAMNFAYRLLRPGGVLSSIGVHTEAQFGFTPADGYDKNITFKIGRCSARHFMTSALMPLVVSKKYDLTSIITHRLDIRDAVSGYDVFDNKREGCIKNMREYIRVAVQKDTYILVRRNIFNIFGIE